MLTYDLFHPIHPATHLLTLPAPQQIDVHFVNVVMDDGGWRTTERDSGTFAKYRVPLVPSAFIQKHFVDAVFPVVVRIVVELNGEVQPTVHTCTLHHDARAKVGLSAPIQIIAAILSSG